MRILRGTAQGSILQPTVKGPGSFGAATRVVSPLARPLLAALLAVLLAVGPISPSFAQNPPSNPAPAASSKARTPARAAGPEPARPSAASTSDSSSPDRPATVRPLEQTR